MGSDGGVLDPPALHRHLGLERNPSGRQRRIVPRLGVTQDHAIDPVPGPTRRPESSPMDRPTSGGRRAAAGEIPDPVGDIPDPPRWTAWPREATPSLR
jgi:hypothetical protein